MDPDKVIVLQTFPNTTAASFAATLLQSRGIECSITSDDCGGMYPPLGLVKLLVDADDADAAREFLARAATTPELAEELLHGSDSTFAKPPPPPVARFNFGLIVGLSIGLILGVLLHLGYTQRQQHFDGTFQYDNDQDGVTDEEIVWRNGQQVESRLDRNGDGRWDEWIFYRDGLIWRTEADDNFDGRVDAWFTYSAKGLVGRAEYDTDFNGIRDITITYTNGIHQQADWQPNGTNVVLRRHFYRDGVLREEWRDVNGDGRFDMSVQFDAFGTPIATNLLPFLPSPSPK